MSLQLSSWRTVPFQRLRKPGLFFCAALFQRFLQDFVFKCLTTRLAFQLANARFPVPQGFIDGDAVVFKPPWSGGQGGRAKQEPVQSILAMQVQTKQEKINKPPSYNPTPRLEG